MSYSNASSHCVMKRQTLNSSLLLFPVLAYVVLFFFFLSLLIFNWYTQRHNFSGSCHRDEETPPTASSSSAYSDPPGSFRKRAALSSHNQHGSHATADQSFSLREKITPFQLRATSLWLGNWGKKRKSLADQTYCWKGWQVSCNSFLTLTHCMSKNTQFLKLHFSGKRNVRHNDLTETTNLTRMCNQMNCTQKWPDSKHAC